MPIAEQVAAVVGGRCSPAQAFDTLMERPTGVEWDDPLQREVPA
jgi:glycerol-3-phosphate dehydrogenase